MDAMVSARVPVELRDQVNEGLRAIGSSPTELINRAYEFFLTTKALPSCDEPSRKGRRRLTRSQAEELVRSIGATSRAVPESFFREADYDRMLEERLRESYEALA